MTMEGILYVNVDGYPAICDNVIIRKKQPLEVQINGVWVPSFFLVGCNGWYLNGLAFWNWNGKKIRIKGK